MTINIKKILLLVVDALMAVYLLLAMTVLNTPAVLGATPHGLTAPDTCRAVNISIADNDVKSFLDRADICSMLRADSLYPLGKPLADVDVRLLEECLANSPFVSSAQCYKSISGDVCVDIAERTPVLRIKAVNGDDYYVDNYGSILPNAKYAANIIIATGHISKSYARHYLSQVGSYIVSNEFWQNAIVQIDVLPDGTLEMVPRVGNHVVFLGHPQNIADKLTRLEKFYKYGLSQIGWNKYSYISVAFSNQIICKKRKK